MGSALDDGQEMEDNMEEEDLTDDEEDKEENMDDNPPYKSIDKEIIKNHLKGNFL